MATINTNKKKNTKAISYMLIILSFLFLIIVTKSVYYDMQVSGDSLDQAKMDLSKKSSDLQELNKIKASLSSDQALATKLSKFEVTVSEQELISYFYEYSYKPNAGVMINSMSMTKGTKNELGFMQSDINLGVTFRDEIAMQTFISFLTAETSKYNLVIGNFSFPYGQNNKNFQVSIPLKLLYY